MAKRSAYASAGVDLAVSNRLKDDLPALLASTQRPEVLGQVGGFGGLFALNTRKYKTPVLVSSVDGVGTKLKVAFAAKRHDTIGQDLVNHCVNDIAVIGAEPLFFLDYIGTGKLRKKAFTDIIRGFAIGCRENNCSLVGGETAQMPSFYQPGEYDVSGTIVGVVEKSRILDGRTIRPGDKLIGIAASGLHTNGYSLARNILFDKMKLKPSSKLPGLGITVADELLKGRTSLVIAHRLSTVQRADRILVLHHGRVREEGRHAELLQLGGIYHRLHQLQYKNNGENGRVAGGNSPVAVSGEAS